MKLLNRVEFYLINESRSSKIDDKQFFDLLNIHCKEHLKFTESKYGFKQIYRGIRGLTDIYAKVDPTISEERTSAYNSNFYNCIVSTSSKWSDFPNRSKSLICSFDYRTANVYGSNKSENIEDRKYDSYVIIPYDGVEFAVCPTEDFTTSFTTPYKMGSKTNIQKKYDKEDNRHIGNIINNSAEILIYLKNNSEEQIDNFTSEYYFFTNYDNRFKKLSNSKILDVLKELDNWKKSLYTKFGSFSKIKKWILNDHPGKILNIFDDSKLSFTFDYLKDESITLYDFIDNLLDPSLYGFKHFTYDGDLSEKLRHINQSREVWVGGPSLMIKFYNDTLEGDDYIDWNTNLQKGKYDLLIK